MKPPPILKRLRSRSMKDQDRRVYRCDICGVDGHPSNVCMFAGESEMSASRRAAVAYEAGMGTLIEIGEAFGVTHPSIISARDKATAARLATLRAMTALLVDDMAAIYAVRGAR